MAADLSGLAKQMADMATQMSNLAIASQESKATAERVEQQQAAMQSRLDAQQARIDSSTVLAAGAPLQLASRGDWLIPTSELLTAPDQEDALVSQKQCADMIQKAISGKVAPIMHATVGAVVQTCAHMDNRLQKVEEELKVLKIRCSWIEKDMLSSQIDVAKRTVLCRNWPDWMSAADRELTIHTALVESQLDPSMVDISTLVQVGENNEKKLAPLTVLTMPSLKYRRELFDFTGSRLLIRYYKTEEGKKVPQEGDGKAKIKMAPGVTQMERRLGAPLHGLMNAYCKEFTAYQRTSLVPRWKTLVLEDSNGSWLGRLKYVRRVKTLNTSSQSPADWECQIQLPEEHFSQLQEAWKTVWYEQLKTQLTQTDAETAAIEELAQKSVEDYVSVNRVSKFMRQSVPEYNEGEENGIQNWVARFRWEYPWPVSFTALEKGHPDRNSYTELDVEQLIAKMETDKATEMEVTADTTMEEAADPTAHSRKRERANSDTEDSKQIKYTDLDWKKKQWSDAEWDVYQAHKKTQKASQSSSSASGAQDPQEIGTYGPHRTQKTAEQVKASALETAAQFAATKEAKKTGQVIES